jgi:Lar family restriction alleviation protein
MNNIFNVERLSKYINCIITIKHYNGKLFYDGLFTKIQDDYIFIKDLETGLYRAISADDFKMGEIVSKTIYFYNPKTATSVHFKDSLILIDKESALKPCPFCGGEAEVSSIIGGGSAVMCKDCEIKTSYIFSSKESAIEFWNRRSNNG